MNRDAGRCKLEIRMEVVKSEVEHCMSLHMMVIMFSSFSSSFFLRFSIIGFGEDMCCDLGG